MKRSFSPIQNSLEKILKTYNLYSSYEIRNILMNWKTLVGEMLSGVSEPVSFDEESQVLKIRVQSQAWKNEFLKQKNALMNKLNKDLKSIAIRDIIIE